MTENPDIGTVGAEDYEYDLAHEATGGRPPQQPARVLPEPPGMHVTDDGGDYSYDAAHDRG